MFRYMKIGKTKKSLRFGSIIVFCGVVHLFIQFSLSSNENFINVKDIWRYVSSVSFQTKNNTVPVPQQQQELQHLLHQNGKEPT